MIENILETGIDALEFLKKMPKEIWDKIDTVVYDPPYFDESDIKRFDRKGKGRLQKDFSKLMMNKQHRETIFELIKSKMKKGFIIKFHQLDILKGQKHIWYKELCSIGSGSVRPNHEYIFVDNINCEYPKMPGLPFILHHTQRRIDTRTAKKELGLYLELFKHFNSKFVLDPFAGYGNSIYAADKLGIPIYACDIDKTLMWDREQKLEDFFD